MATITEYHAAAAKDMSEKELQDTILKCARSLNWTCYHTYDSRRSDKGFPDLVMVRGTTIIFAELKAERGRIKPEQRQWAEALKVVEHACLDDEPDIRHRYWYPRDWLTGMIEAELR